MAVDPERMREWREAAQKYADMAVKLVQALPEEPTERDYSRVSMVASISALYYATALDADHFGDAPEDVVAPE
ncbi:hypothetical protein [Mycobacterium sp. 1081908.1]|uniref:hypothetical protein n=1 Tax=Mycobacterium sp. 1081908.1 TaxID=1834066 RepID=UPI000A9331DE|nr:hypothetical protein [Mycobacterium sp. 1081908.1]